MSVGELQFSAPLIFFHADFPLLAYFFQRTDLGGINTRDSLLRDVFSSVPLLGFCNRRPIGLTPLKRRHYMAVYKCIFIIF